MTATAQNGATITRQSITNGNTTYTTTPATFANVESGVFSLSATDSRGFTTTVGRNQETAGKFVPYVRLTCNMENTRPDASGNMDVRCIGNFFNGSFGAVENTLTVQYRYKIIGGTYSGWNTMTVVKNGNTYGAYASFTIPNFDYHASYAFECQAVDKLATVSSSESSLKSMPVFHWGENDFVFEVPVDVKGDLRLKGDGNFGNTLRFGDGDYCLITEDSDDVMTIKANFINLDALGVYLYGSLVADFPIETGTTAMGTNGTWYWTKWLSGKAECYGVRNYGNMGISNSFGNWYSSEKFTQSFPSGLFVAPPDYLNINVHKSNNGSGIVEMGTSGLTATQTNKFALLYPEATTFQQVYFNFHAIGRWK
jgi:hypothetical protein